MRTRANGLAFVAACALAPGTGSASIRGPYTALRAGRVGIVRDRPRIAAIHPVHDAAASEGAGRVAMSGHGADREGGLLEPPTEARADAARRARRFARPRGRFMLSP